MPWQQCPVCGQKMDRAAPSCPQCGAAMALVMKPARLLTKIKWLDALLGMIVGWGLVMGLAITTLHMLDNYVFSWVPVLFIALVVTVGAYLLIRRFYPLVARGLIIGYIIGLLLILGILWLMSHPHR